MARVVRVGLLLEETKRWGTASISSIWYRAEPLWADVLSPSLIRH